MDQMRGDAHTAHREVATEPDDGARGCRKDEGSPKHDQRAVDDGRIDRAPEAGRAIGWQLEMEGGDFAAEQCAREHPRAAEHERHAQKDDAHDGHQRDEPAVTRRYGGTHEERGQQDLRRPTPVAEREVVRDNGDQSLARTVDDTRGDDARSVAAEAHAHRQRLLAMRPGSAEEFVEIESHAGQIAEVLQQREEREEDGHRRQHDGDDPRGGEVDAVDQQPRDPRRRTEAHEEAAQGRMDEPHEQVAQPRRRVVRTHDRHPKDAREQRDHDRETPHAMRQDAIQPHVHRQSAAAVALRYDVATDRLSLGIDILHPLVVKVVADLEVDVFGQRVQLRVAETLAYARILLDESESDPFGVR